MYTLVFNLLITYVLIFNLAFVVTGKEVIIVNGEYRGDRAIMTSVNMKKFTADVEICEVSRKVLFFGS